MNNEEKWLSALSESSRRVYERNWEYFKEFTGLTTEEILEAKHKERNGDWKAKLLQFRTWILEEKGLSPNSAKTATGVVRGFFAFFETPIILTRGEKQRLKKGGRSTKDYKFSRKDVAKMALVSNLEEQYILMLGKSVGLRAGDFLKFTYGDLRKVDLESEVPIFLGDYNTTKKGIPAYCFIDSDALPVVKAILEANKNKKDSDRVITVRSGELSIILQRIADKAGVESGNDRIRFHCLRKWLSTRLSASMAESQWKQIVGKTIDEGAYISSDMLRRAYERCLKDLTVMSGNGNGHSAKVEQLMKAVKDLESEVTAKSTRIDLLKKDLEETEERINETISKRVGDAMTAITKMLKSKGIDVSYEEHPENCQCPECKKEREN